ncbi:MAG TPA: Ig-like domain-containing protein [Gemmataceae bacterium]|nr:Ig-like domain-containing protein [Gemmataceae bacterium]
MILLRWLREVNEKLLSRGNRDSRRPPAQRDATARPVLEHLEDRVVPSVDTTTNIAIAITPNFLGHTATETITATVTQSNTNTPVTAGSVGFIVNNQPASVPVNSNGQATFSLSLPLSAVATNETVLVAYSGTLTITPSGPDGFLPSGVLSPVYLNLMNELLPSHITFATPENALSNAFVLSSIGGETDAVSLLFLPIDFNYGDPGVILSMKIGELTLPGQLASAFGIPY